MIIHRQGKIDGQHEVEIVFHAVGYTDTATPLSLYHEFITSGGLVYLFYPDTLNIQRTQPSHTTAIFRFSTFPFGVAGLMVFVRIMFWFNKSISSVSVNGASIHDSTLSTLEPTQDSLTLLPNAAHPLPFEIELSPQRTWINLECHFHGEITDDESHALIQFVETWGKVVNLAGFQEDLLMQAQKEKPTFGLHIDSPAVGSDFISWSFPMTGVPIESLNCLINIFASFSHQQHAISNLYIG